MIKTILFDLDGTLLPMNQETFVKAYLDGLAQKLAPLGYDKDLFIKGMWAGVAAMVKNDGSCVNQKRFWDTFCSILGEHVRNDESVFEDFYKNEFQQVKSVCGFNPKAGEVIQKLKEQGFRLILATNPLFPSIATESRIQWAGLSPNDFSLYTTYENSSYCKPNPKYYEEILKRSNCNPKECLMVGNDVNEDMIAKDLGINVFLLTDCLINTDNKNISDFPQGSFDELLNFLK